MSTPEGQVVNRIGVGVGYIDPNDSTLTYLSAIEAKLRAIQGLRGSLPRGAGGTGGGPVVSPYQSRRQESDRMGQLLKADEQKENQSARNRANVDKQLARERADSQKAVKREVDSFFDASEKKLTAQHRIEEQARTRATQEEASKRANAERQIAQERARQLPESMHLFNRPPAGSAAEKVWQRDPDVYVRGIAAARAEADKVAQYEARYGRRNIPADIPGISQRAREEADRQIAERTARQESAQRRATIRGLVRTQAQELPEGFELQQAEKERAKRLQARYQSLQSLPQRRDEAIRQQNEQFMRQMDTLTRPYGPTLEEGQREQARRQRAERQQAEQQRQEETRRRYAASPEGIAAQAVKDRATRERERASRAAQRLVEEEGERARQEELGRRNALRYRVQGPELGPTRADFVDSPSRRQAQLEEERERARERGLRGYARQTAVGPELGPTRRDFLEIDKARESLDKLDKSAIAAQRNLKNIELKGAQHIQTDAKLLSHELRQAQEASARLRAELARPASMRRTKDAVVQDLNAIQQRMHQVEAQARKLQSQNIAAGPQPQQGQNPFGTLETGTRIARNLIIYSLFRTATTDLKEYTQASIEAARVAEETRRQLEFTSLKSGQTFEANIRLAESVRDQQLVSRRVAQETVAGATKFAEESGRISNVEGLVTAIEDIGAKRGISQDEITSITQRLGVLGERGVQQILGKQPATIYEEEGKRRLAQGQLSEFSPEGRRLTDTEQVKEYVNSLDEAQKKQLLFDETIRQGSEVVGAAAQRHASLAGTVERLTGRYEDLSVTYGQIILRNKDLASGLADVAKILENIAGFSSEQIGHGPGGILNEADIKKYARERAGSNLDALISSQTTSPYISQARAFKEDPGLTGISTLVGGPLPRYFMDAYYGGVKKGNLAEDELRQERNRQLQRAAEEGRKVTLGPGGAQVESNEDYKKRKELEFNQKMEADRKKALEDDKERVKNAREFQRVQEMIRQDLNDQTEALARVRGIEKESLNYVGQIASTRTGAENPFTKIFADGATAVARMKLEFGSLGQEAVKFFTQMEQQRLGQQYIEASFGSLSKYRDLMGQINRMQREREGPGLSSFEQALVGGYQASANAAVQNPQLYARARLLRQGIGTAPDDQIREQLENLNRNRRAFSRQFAGLGPDAQDAIEGVLDQAVIGLADQAGDAIFRNPRLRGLRLDTGDALTRTAERNNREVERAVQRAEIVAQANDEVTQNVAQSSAQRARLIAQGRDPRFVDAAADRDILALTQGLSAKDMTPQTFQAAIQARRREAQRTVEQESKAQKEVEEASKWRTDLLGLLKNFRDGVLQGNLKLIIQLLNDTQGRADAQSLKKLEQQTQDDLAQNPNKYANAMKNRYGKE